MNHKYVCFRQERITTKQGQEQHETHMKGTQKAAHGVDWDSFCDIIQ